MMERRRGEKAAGLFGVKRGVLNEKSRKDHISQEANHEKWDGSVCQGGKWGEKDKST